MSCRSVFNYKCRGRDNSGFYTLFFVIFINFLQVYIIYLTHRKNYKDHRRLSWNALKKGISENNQYLFKIIFLSLFFQDDSKIFWISEQDPDKSAAFSKTFKIALRFRNHLKIWRVIVKNLQSTLWDILRKCFSYLFNILRGIKYPREKSFILKLVAMWSTIIGVEICWCSSESSSYIDKRVEYEYHFDIYDQLKSTVSLWYFTLYSYS